ncbi:hypothetical protein LNAOJCKE_0429 [Methylorubrum aminovorans]|uniref:Uncharacterized protein n=1 Tax=Methylorubrum aminovorans TaxID=269069 RepID=A0ABQ4U719_9HYPH|nr:hypothetical protein [Methylorubrum aminovorans]GJE63235.1 hypothetical protein LNAOJCKE_0429 [Methylorubrum aminovorans]
MADDINSLRGEVKDVSTGLTDVKVAIGVIKATTDETNRRIEKLDHDFKNVRQIGAAVELVKQKLDGMLDRLKEIEREKADKVETDHRFSKIEERVTRMEDDKKKLGDKISKWTTPFVLAILMAVGGYIAAKLGFTDFLTGGRP